MAPKKKGVKKEDDDWEADLGETIDPVASAAEQAENGDAPAENGAPQIGGLMAAIKKTKLKKQKKGKNVDEFVEREDIHPNGEVQDEPTELPTIDLNAKAPQEGSLENEFDGKGKKGKPAPPKKEGKGEDDEERDESGRVMTKKEKEKAKKEREKQRKKEQAAKKKTTSVPAPIVKETKSTESKSSPQSTGPTAEAAGKKKKVPAALAALQKQQEERRLREEEKNRADVEEKKRLEEEERIEAEEQKKKDEARALKKQKEKEKVQQLKKAGKYLTPAQKEAQARLELRNKQLLNAEGGVVRVAGLEDGAEIEKKKPVYEKKRKGKKGPGDKEEDLEEAAAKEKARQAAEEKRRDEEARQEAEAEAAKEESSEDDWEADEAQQDGDIKESWDASSEDEDQMAKKSDLTGASAKLASRPRKAPVSDSDSDESSDDETKTAAKRAIDQKKHEAAIRRQKQHEEALAARSKDNLRSPICCILGHVDTGKTKLLDKIRQTNVQDGEAGGITQQIGATYFPTDALKQKTAVVNQDGSFEFKVPGLLVIDTPGHESFSNLRSRGSSLCNIAILVVDIMHGLEPQTLESMRLLRERKTPFIVALNKIDRLYSWKPIANNGFQESLMMQNKGVQREFEDRLEKTKLAFAEQGFNTELFFQNKSMSNIVSLVPTSAHTGEGIPDMLKLLVKLSQERMTNKLMYLSEIECTVLEVKVVEGLGTTIDVVLSNGILREGDRIVLCGLNGAITTNIRALLTPAPLKELRLKSQYVHNKEAKAALGIKIAANDLESAIAGSRLLVVGPDDDEEDLEEEVMSDLAHLLSKVSTTGRGVSVQASTLGSLEALLEFLRVSKIPVANISIGPVFKRDVMQAGTMLEKAKEFAVMLCFDVKVDKDAQAYAEDQGIKIFQADIIYHLFDAFTKHMAQLTEQRKEDAKLLAVFPCVLSPLAVFNKKDPIVVGVDVTEGCLKVGTPVAAVKTNSVTNAKEIITLGRVTSIERDHKQVPVCKRGQPSVAVKIEGPNQPLYGRQLEDKDILYSLISRQSIDTLKTFYRDEMKIEDWHLIVKLKGLFDVA
ncbi:MAG: hypothetical protein M1814_004210 [Vezdaea aestivalis]|nr:MAG: hypothetical protein M1814_004210 [Vezdaea aestivalis]